MTLPTLVTYVRDGAGSAIAGSGTPLYGASITPNAGDLLVMLYGSPRNGDALVFNTPAGETVRQSDYINLVTGSTFNPNLYLRTIVATGATINPTVSFSGGAPMSWCAFQFRGADPDIVYGLSTGPTTTSTSGTSPGVTTTDVDALVFNYIFAGPRTFSFDPTVLSAFSNSNLSSFSLLFQHGSTGSNNSAHIGVTEGELASAGATGDVTFTADIARVFLYGTFAVQPGVTTRGLVVGSMTLN